MKLYLVYILRRIDQNHFRVPQVQYSPKIMNAQEVEQEVLRPQEHTSARKKFKSHVFAVFPQKLSNVSSWKSNCKKPLNVANLKTRRKKREKLSRLPGAAVCLFEDQKLFENPFMQKLTLSKRNMLRKHTFVRSVQKIKISILSNDPTARAKMKDAKSFCLLGFRDGLVPHWYVAMKFYEFVSPDSSYRHW